MAKCRREHDVTLELEEIKWEGVNWIHLSEFNDCRLYNVNTTPHTPAPFFGLVPTPAASIHQHHTLNSLVEQDASVTRDEIFSEIHFDVVFKLICNIMCSLV